MIAITQTVPVAKNVVDAWMKKSLLQNRIRKYYFFQGSTVRGDKVLNQPSPLAFLGVRLPPKSFYPFLGCWKSSLA